MGKSVIHLYSNADITNRCIHILCGRMPPKLNFKLAGLQVTASGLAKVAQAIRKNRIHVGYFNSNKPIVNEQGYGVFPPAVAGMPYGTMAVYSIKDNEIWLTKPPTKLFYEAMVAHEATHALFDLNNWDCSTRVAEAAAFIVEGWYLWRYGYKAKKGTREKMMIEAAKAFATMSDPSRRNKYKKKYPKDWKQRMIRRRKKFYKALVDDLGKSYDLGESVDFDGV